MNFEFLFLLNFDYLYQRSRRSFFFWAFSISSFKSYITSRNVHQSLKIVRNFDVFPSNFYFKISIISIRGQVPPTFFCGLQYIVLLEVYYFQKLTPISQSREEFQIPFLLLFIRNFDYYNQGSSSSIFLWAFSTSSSGRYTTSRNIHQSFNIHFHHVSIPFFFLFPFHLFINLLDTTEIFVDCCRFLILTSEEYKLI